ncbi:Ig-like domain-containing protein [Eubacteriales bacterium KG127]
MKKFSAAICLVLILMMSGTLLSFGASGDLEIKNTYPIDGQKNTTVENMSVKLDFNQKVGSKENRKANNKVFAIKDEDGKKIPIRVMYNPKDAKQVMVIADTHDGKLKIKEDSKYTLYIGKGFVSDEGGKLGKDVKITFQTMNQKRNTMVYMVLMVVMFAGMFFFTSRSAKKAKEAEEINDDIKINPYKEAKRTGKSVEDIVAKHEKEKARRAARAEKARAKREAEEAELASYYEEELPPGHFKVKGPRPISAAGGKTISGRKAAAEARRAQEEKWAASKKKKHKK